MRTTVKAGGLVLAAGVLAGAAFGIYSVADTPAPRHHHHAASVAVATAPVPPPFGCSNVTGAGFGKVAADLSRQNKDFTYLLAKTPLPAGTAADLAAGAWTPPGTYSGALGNLLSSVSPDPTETSSPVTLAQDTASLLQAAQTLQSDEQAGGQASGANMSADMLEFSAAASQVAIDCGIAVSPSPWAGS